MQPYFKQTEINCVEMKPQHLDATLLITQITDHLLQQSGIFSSPVSHTRMSLEGTECVFPYNKMAIYLYNYTY